MILYIIKVILCSGLFLLTYRGLLEKQKIYGFNRVYLLSCLLLSFTIPIFTFRFSLPVLQSVEDIILAKNSLPGVMTIQQYSPVSSRNYFLSISLGIYVITTALLLFRFIYNLKILVNKVHNNPTISYRNCKIVLINEDLIPYSFFNYIFINKEDYRKGNIENEILAHEYAHISQKHSYDILIMEVCQTFLWFNPFVFIYRKAIQLNHEFLADEAVIIAYKNIHSYQNLLIEKAGKRQTFNLANQFNYSITKKRLIMMTKTVSPVNILCRQIAIVPVLAFVIFLFSSKTFAQDSLPIPKTKQNAAQSIQKGVSPELLSEYEQIVNRSKDKTGFPDFHKFPDADVDRLKTIYLSMNQEQQAKQIVTFILIGVGANKYNMVIHRKDEVIVVERQLAINQ